MGHYKSYPKIVGETGGKNFIFAHPSAPALDVATAIVRGAFEYQGQKCSAGSRAYIPASLWKEVKDYVGDMLKEIKMGDVQDFTNFVNVLVLLQVEGLVTEQHSGSLNDGAKDTVESSQHHHVKEKDTHAQDKRP